MHTEVIHVREASQIAPAGRAAAEALSDGQVVGFPTETVYGLAALATHAGAMERLREIKSRPSRPFSVHLGGREQIARYLDPVPGPVRRLIARAWPGPVTFLLRLSGRFADESLHGMGLYDELCQDDVIGLRCPDELVAQAMCQFAMDPVVATSANLAGGESPRSREDVLAGLDGQIPLLIDTGPTRCRQDSTIVKFDVDAFEIVRPGPVDSRQIRRFARRHYVFVCTGNTCRSPMAAGLAKAELARIEGCRVGELRGRGIEVHSAGLYAANGHRATPEAVSAAKHLGADISRHRSRRLTAELIDSADAVFCMTAAHEAEAKRLAGAGAAKVHRLLPRQDIPDPIGAGPDIYQQTARCIADALKQRLDEVAS